MTFETQLNQYRNHINQAIKNLLPPPATTPPLIHEAMHYSLQAGGKRLRPILVLASHSLFPSDIDPLPAAIAIECLHTSTLIHDDLPCMDNSHLRRGHPTSHKKFDEATALLAGDALLTYAFHLISHHYKNTPSIAINLIRDLSHSAGSQKLIGGQIEDLNAPKYDSTPEKLDFIHLNKTAALITTSLTFGIHLNQQNDNTLDLIKKLGYHFGLAFQIVDDILDVTAIPSSLGKNTGIDSENNKLTYPSLYGLSASRQKAHEHTQNAIDTCNQINANNAFLIELIESLENRIS